ncbi:hypothetical protein JCM10213v2_008780 [Rhodosporidiobolus nylandii]
MADDLFSPPGSRTTSRAPSPSVEPANSPTLAATSSSAPPAPALAFAPRAVKRKVPPARRAGAALANAAAASSSSSSSTPTAAAAIGSSAAAATPPAEKKDERKEEKLTAPERDRLEVILQTVEGALSDWGLSSFGRGPGRILSQLRGSGNDHVHISVVLALPPVRALTGTLADLQKALRLRDSGIVKLDDSGFQVGRKVKPDYEKLEAMDLTEWDDCVVYLENIPYHSSSDVSLPLFLSSCLSSVSQKIILPPVYNSEDPPSLSDDEDEEGGEPSQAELFAQSQAASREGTVVSEDGGKRKPRPLPKGGGPFKGYGFVLLGGKEDAERVAREWSWEGERRAQEEGQAPEEAVEEGEKMDVEQEQEGEGEGKKVAKGKGKEKAKLSPVERARRSGMRALSYTRWLALKKEYLAYRRSLTTLLEARETGDLDRLRNPPTRDLPPHLAGRDHPPPKRNKRAASPAHAATDFADVSAEIDAALASDPAFAPSSASTADWHPPPPAKKVKRASSPPSLPSFTRRVAKLKTPPPTLDLDSSEALGVQGAYPESCVLWVRNVHEKSTKTSLKGLFGALLEQLQEGSGKGVEFVDYEKGSGMCYLRFSSSPLALLALHHLTSTPSLHLAQTSLSPVSSLSPADAAKAEADLRRPLIAELLTGEQERRYWAAVPEPARRKAREAARGRVGLVKEPKQVKIEEGDDEKPFFARKEEEDVKPRLEEEKPQGGGQKKRKKASKF